MQNHVLRHKVYNDHFRKVKHSKIHRTLSAIHSRIKYLVFDIFNKLIKYAKCALLCHRKEIRYDFFSISYIWKEYQEEKGILVLLLLLFASSNIPFSYSISYEIKNSSRFPFRFNDNKFKRSKFFPCLPFLARVVFSNFPSES